MFILVVFYKLATRIRCMCCYTPQHRRIISQRSLMQNNSTHRLRCYSLRTFHSTAIIKVEARLVDEVEFCSLFAAIHNCCFLVCHTKLCTYFNHVRFFTKQYVAAAIFLIVDSIQDSLHVLPAQLMVHRKADDLLGDAVGDRKVLLRSGLKPSVRRELTDQGIEVSAAVDVP